ncbi:SpoIIE family protein phosphatase [bacterium]|nr:SpoIIE family protein phosphatase [bacterium]
MMSQADISPKLRKLIRINQTVAGSLDISEVLKRSLELEREVVDAETGSILLLDPTGEYLEFAVALGDAENILKNHRIRVGEGIAGHVAKHRQPLLIEDVRKDKRFNAYFDGKTGFQTRSVLCVPIEGADRLIGVAQVINRTDGGSFTDEDLGLFSAFSGTLGVAIENARLHKHLLDQEKIRQEITAARQVQESYLPREFPALEGTEFSGRLAPAQQVSGDFYDAFRTPDGRVAVLIGDVSGKGLPAALYMCRLVTEIRGSLKHDRRPEAALGAVNRHLAEQSTRGMFVTMILFLIESTGRKMTVANAGHLPYLLYKDGRWQSVSRDKNPPLGILPDRVFVSHRVDLPPGSRVLAVTDGVTEARNSAGELYGMGRFEALLSKNDLPPALLLEKIYLDLDRFGGESDPVDDTTAVGFGNMAGVSRLSFEMTSHPAYLALVRNAAARVLTGVDPKILTEIQVALSEAVSNVIRHTYKNDQTREIEITMEASPDGFETVVRDYGPKVDPARVAGRALEDVRPGGLGVHFIRKIFEEFRYDPSVPDGNRLVLRRRLEC